MYLKVVKKKIKINEQELKKGSMKEYESRVNNNEREKPVFFFFGCSMPY